MEKKPPSMRFRGPGDDPHSEREWFLSTKDPPCKTMSCDDDVHLLFLDASKDGSWKDKLMACTIRSKKLYVFECGTWHRNLSNTRTVDWIAECFACVASERPRADVVPLLPEAGWSLEKIASLDDLHGAFRFVEDDGIERKHWESLQSARQELGKPLLEIMEMHSVSKDRDFERSENVDTGSKEEDCSFEYVAVGGTFDRLHAGHRVLLAVSAVCCTSKLYVGITSDLLLVNKADKEMLQDYTTRERVVCDFVHSVRPDLEVSTGALSDPQEPTVASTHEHIQALVVSEETIKGGQLINEDRKIRGFVPLKLIVIKLLLGKAEEKLSSTALRHEDRTGQAIGKA